VLEGLQEL